MRLIQRISLLDKVLRRYPLLGHTSKAFPRHYVLQGYLCLWGETLGDLEEGCAIMILGNAGIGKTTTTDIISDTYERYTIMANSDKILYDYGNRVIVPSFEGLEPMEIKRVIRMISQQGYEEYLHYPGLEQTLRFIEDELHIPPEDFPRVEGEPEETARDLYEFLVSNPTSL